MAKVLTVINGIPQSIEIATLITIYDEYYTVSSTITSGSTVTLPNSGSYTGKELEIYVNGVLQDYSNNYNYVGSGTKTGISFTFDLYTGDVIRFRKIREE